MQQARHEACADVLEGECGAVEEFECVDVRLHLNEGSVELEGVIYDASEIVGRDVLAEEGVGHAIGNLLEGEVGNLFEEVFGQLLDDFGHIETAVFGETSDDGLAERGTCGVVVGAVVEHLNCRGFNYFIFNDLCFESLNSGAHK